MVMQRKRSKDSLTAAEYARLRGLNRSMISRQIRSGQIPTHDGLIDPTEADRARERNLDPAKRVAAKMRRQRELSQNRETADARSGGERSAVVAALAEVAKAAAVLEVAVTCRRMGIPAAQACAVGQIFGHRVLECLSAEEIEELPEVSEEQWIRALGSFDIDEADRLVCYREGEE